MLPANLPDLGQGGPNQGWAGHMMAGTKRGDTMPKHITQKQREAAVDAALERLNRGEVPHCGASNPVEPCLNDSGENLFMCDFRDGGICKSCGADAPGGTGCFSVALGPTKEGLERAAAADARMRAELNDKNEKEARVKQNARAVLVGPFGGPDAGHGAHRIRVGQAGCLLESMSR